MICTSAVRFPGVKIKSIKLSICLNISLPFFLNEDNVHNRLQAVPDFKY